MLIVVVAPHPAKSLTYCGTTATAWKDRLFKNVNLFFFNFFIIFRWNSKTIGDFLQFKSVINFFLVFHKIDRIKRLAELSRGGMYFIHIPPLRS
jgi:hypothetical protein